MTARRRTGVRAVAGDLAFLALPLLVLAVAPVLWLVARLFDVLFGRRAPEWGQR